MYKHAVERHVTIVKGKMVHIRDNHAAVVPLVGNEIATLHAVHAQSCLGPVKSLMDSKRYQVRLSYDQVPVRFVREDEIKRLVPQTRPSSISTPSMNLPRSRPS